MVRRGIDPNEITLSNLLQALSVHPHVAFQKKGLEIYEEMEKFGIVPNEKHEKYITVIREKIAVATRNQDQSFQSDQDGHYLQQQDGVENGIGLNNPKLSEME